LSFVLHALPEALISTHNYRQALLKSLIKTGSIVAAANRWAVHTQMC